MRFEAQLHILTDESARFPSGVDRHHRLLRVPIEKPGPTTGDW